jgi:protein-tyrosine-phosphatase/predicted ATP-grasp superfamily ATP-dependent carboligase
MTSPQINGKVLVLGDDTRSFLSVIRSLGRAGLQVHAAWCPHSAPGLRSRFVTQAHHLTEYEPDTQAWLADFLRLLERERFDLVIPVPDTAIFPMQHWRNRIEALAPCYLLSDQAFEVTSDKGKTYDLAAQLGIRLPRQRTVTTANELVAASGELGFPLVLKPRSSFTLGDVWERRKVLKLRDRDEIMQRWSERQPQEPMLAQEYVAGTGCGVSVLARDGEILTAFQHERLHETLTGGGSSYRKSVSLSPELLEAAARLMRALNYTGVAMVEFKVNATNGTWSLMEINGRFWGSLPLALAAGLDFPRYLYEMLCHGRTDFPRSYRAGRYARNWLADLHWLSGNLRANRNDPYLSTLPLTQLPRELLNVVRLAESSDTFTWDDPGPALAEAREYLREKVMPKLQRSSLLRRKIAASARSTASRAQRVLFVCKGNICRSPFAEWALRRSLPNRIEVRSAGFFPPAGRHSPEPALTAASRFQVDLSGHRSRVLDAGTVSWADFILFMDFECEQMLRSKMPDALRKAHYIGAFHPRRLVQIPDPFGQGPEVFERTFRQLLDLVGEVGRVIADAQAARKSIVREVNSPGGPQLRVGAGSGTRDTDAVLQVTDER